MAATKRHGFSVGVEDLGPIKQARVELAPLTLFVGENNSGKSYLATVLWALHRAPVSLFDFQDDPAVQRFVAQLEEVQARAKETDVSIEDYLSAEFSSVDIAAEGVASPMSPALQARGLQALMQMAFRTDALQPKLSLPIDTRDVQIKLVQGKDWSWWSWATTIGGHGITWHGGTNVSMLREVTRTILFDLSGFPDSEWLFAPITAPGHPALYFPGSRTGFVHLLPELYDRLLDRAGQINGGSEFLPGVPAPTLQFLRFLTQRRRNGPVAHPELLTLLERSVLRGQIVWDPARQQADFIPAGGQQAVPLGRSSAVVSELVPLMLLLRDWAQLPKLLIYEEPEAHLHPRLQRIVAQILVRLVRKGTHVLVTSHSETLLQQINNFIKLGRVPVEQRAALSARWGASPYGAEDYLAEGEVAAYGFTSNADGSTEVSALDVDEWGVTAPTFNEELIRLSEETMAIDALLQQEP